MSTEGKVLAINGEEIDMAADTICLHSDTPGAGNLAQALRQRLEAAGVLVVPMGTFCK